MLGVARQVHLVAKYVVGDVGGFGSGGLWYKVYGRLVVGDAKCS